MIDEGSISINPETLRIDFRKGDTGKVCFRLNENLSDGIFWFTVKENIAQTYDEAPIYKCLEHPGGALVLIPISEEESDRLTVDSDCSCCRNHKDYIWGLKYSAYIYDENDVRVGLSEAKTLIPRLKRKPPIFRVYPEIIEGPHV